MNKINIDIEKIKNALSSPLIEVPKHENVEDKMKWLMSELKQRKTTSDK